MDEYTGVKQQFGNTIFGQGGDTHGFDVHVRTTNAIRFQQQTASGTSFINGPTLSLEQWHFYAARYNHSTETMKLRINDVDYTPTTGVTPQVGLTHKWWAGASDSGGGQQYLNGRLCRLGLWQRELSDAEVDDLYDDVMNGGDCEAHGSLNDFYEFFDFNESIGDRVGRNGTVMTQVDQHPVGYNSGPS